MKVEGENIFKLKHYLLVSLLLQLIHFLFFTSFHTIFWLFFPKVNETELIVVLNFSTTSGTWGKHRGAFFLQWCDGGDGEEGKKKGGGVSNIYGVVGWTVDRSSGIVKKDKSKDKFLDVFSICVCMLEKGSSQP